MAGRSPSFLRALRQKYGLGEFSRGGRAQASGGVPRLLKKARRLPGGRSLKELIRYNKRVFGMSAAETRERLGIKPKRKRRNVKNFQM